jgi:hypothetical protein
MTPDQLHGTGEMSGYNWARQQQSVSSEWVHAMASENEDISPDLMPFTSGFVMGVRKALAEAKEYEA